MAYLSALRTEDIRKLDARRRAGFRREPLADRRCPRHLLISDACVIGVWEVARCPVCCCPIYGSSSPPTTRRARQHGPFPCRDTALASDFSCHRPNPHTKGLVCVGFLFSEVCAFHFTLLCSPISFEFPLSLLSLPKKQAQVLRTYE